MDLLAAFRTLIRVAETGSFSAVAREMDVTQPSVSRQISALERHLGARLLHRTTHDVTLTDDGRGVLEQARHVVEAVDCIQDTVGQRRGLVSGRVRLAVSVTLGLHLAARAAGLLARHPGLSLELVTADRMPDLVHEGLDLAVSLGELDAAHIGSAVTRRIGGTRSVLVASPGYLAGAKPIGHPGELASFDCVVNTASHEAHTWRFVAGNDAVTVVVGGRLLVDNRESVQAAVAAGQGLGLLSELRVRGEIAAGRLVQVLPGWRTPEAPIHVVYPSRRNLPARTRAVIDFLVDEAALLAGGGGALKETGAGGRHRGVPPASRG